MKFNWGRNEFKLRENKPGFILGELIEGINFNQGGAEIN